MPSDTAVLLQGIDSTVIVAHVGNQRCLCLQETGCQPSTHQEGTSKIRYDPSMHWNTMQLYKRVSQIYMHFSGVLVNV